MKPGNQALFSVRLVVEGVLGAARDGRRSDRPAREALGRATARSSGRRPGGFRSLASPGGRTLWAWPNPRIADPGLTVQAARVSDVLIERDEVVAFLFNVSDIAVTLTRIERLLLEDDDGEEEADQD